MKKTLLSSLTTFGLFVSALSNAAPITYDLAVPGGKWVTVRSTAFGLTGQPDLTGWVTFDNELTGFNAITSFYFTTGTHTWDMSEFTGPVANAFFDSHGNLSQFSLASFASGNVSMYFHSNNTVNIFSDTGAFYCNQCVEFAPGVARAASEVRAVPEPATLLLVGIGMMWFARKRAVRREGGLTLR